MFDKCNNDFCSTLEAKCVENMHLCATYYLCAQMLNVSFSNNLFLTKETFLAFYRKHTSSSTDAYEFPAFSNNLGVRTYLCMGVQSHITKHIITLRDKCYSRLQGHPHVVLDKTSCNLINQNQRKSAQICIFIKLIFRTRTRRRPPPN
jgi:hypothetical protein